MKMKVLLDNSVISAGFMDIAEQAKKKYEFYITARTDAKNDYRSKDKYPWLNVVGEAARFGHSIWGSGELWASSGSKEISDRLLAVVANQKSIVDKNISKQTSFNQRDDADIVTCAIEREFNFLVSNDKKFMLKKEVIEFAKNRNLEILNSEAFLNMIK